MTGKRLVRVPQATRKPLTEKQIAEVLDAPWVILNGCWIYVPLDDIPLTAPVLRDFEYCLPDGGIQMTEDICPEHRAYDRKAREFHVT